MGSKMLYVNDRVEKEQRCGYFWTKEIQRELILALVVLVMHNMRADVKGGRGSGLLYKWFEVQRAVEVHPKGFEHRVTASLYYYLATAENRGF